MFPSISGSGSFRGLHTCTAPRSPCEKSPVGGFLRGIAFDEAAASFWRKTSAGFVEMGMNHTSSPRLRLYVERPLPRMAAIPRGCIFRPSESKETVGVSPPSREKQVQVHGRESTGVLFGKKWQRNASQSAPPRVIYSDWNPFLLRMESSPSMRIL